MEANHRHWDERAPLHVTSEFYDLDGFRAGRSTLRAVEVEEVGDVTGLELLHLQCHFGLDTLSWARRGRGRVTGLDFSESAVEAARALAGAEGIDAEFVCANVYDAVGGAVGAYLRRGLHGDRGTVLAARHRPLGGHRRRAGQARWLALRLRAPPVHRRARHGRSVHRSPLRVRVRQRRAAAHAMGWPRLLCGARRGDRPQRRLRVEPQPRRGRLGPDRARPRARVPARALLHAVAAVAVPRRDGTRDLASARRVRGAVAPHVLAAPRPGRRS